MFNYAYVTYASDIKYLKCALALSASLLQVKSQFPLIILYPEDEEIFDFNDFKLSNIILKKITRKLFKKNMNTNTYLETLNKFHILTMEEYEKIIYLDADMLCFKNPDELFQLQFPILDNFRFEQTNKFVPAGVFGLCPNLELYNTILLERDKKYSDVQILLKLYKEEKNFWNNFSHLEYFIHDILTPKYFSLLSIDDLKNKILNYNEKYLINELYNFINKKTQHYIDTNKPEGFAYRKEKLVKYIN